MWSSKFNMVLYIIFITKLYNLFRHIFIKGLKPMFDAQKVYEKKWQSVHVSQQAAVQ